MYRNFIFVLLFILFSVTVTAQERLGVIGSNFAGSQGVMINPSSIVNSKLFMDVNILSFDVSTQNNYLYIPKEDYSLGGLIKEIDRNIKFYNENGNWMDRDSMLFHESTFQHGKDIYSFFNATVMGPSAMYSINDQAFGFYSAFRNMGHVKGVPFEQANFAYWGFNFNDQLSTQYSSSGYGGAAASWLELGFTYARVLKKTYNKHLSAGITLKRMMSYAGSYLDINNVSYEINASYSAIVDESDFGFGYALPIDYQSNEYNGLSVLGRGWGFDLGITYQLKTRGYELTKYKRACEQEFEPYIFKLGVSLIDIGKMKYNSNARAHEYSGSMYWESIDTLQFRSVMQISTDLSNRYYGSPTESLRDTTFSIGLPTTLSIQADYHYDKNIYFGGLLMMPLKISKNQLRRPSLIAFIPRYESKNFEVSTPFSLYNFNSLRMGLSVRYGPLTLGTDKLGAFLGASDLDGFDIYFMLKINFLKGRCANDVINVCD